MTTTTQATLVGRGRIVRQSRAASTAPVVQRIRVVTEIAALLVIALLLVALPILSRDAKTTVPTATAEVIMQPGDTLWSVAQSHPLPGLTTAQAVDHIASMNGIDSARIPVGSSILVPTDVSHLVLACN